MSELRDRELRDLLERVSAIEGEVDVDEQWVAGRKRRTRRAAAVAVAAGVAVIAAAGAVAQTGLLGGSATAPTGPAAVPDDLETFVFAVPGAVGQPDEADELRHATPDQLAGTRWVLQEELWSSTTAASELTGTTARTVLAFGQATDPWSVTVGDCGLATVERLRLDDQGRFTGVEPGSTDLGCPADVQAAEEFWLESLSGGGTLTLLEDPQWLLLSVAAPASSTPDPTPGPEPAPTTEPGEDEGPDAGAGPPAEDPTAAPTEDGTAAPTAGSSPTPTPDPATGAPPAPTGAPPAAPPSSPPAVPPAAPAPPSSPPSSPPAAPSAPPAPPSATPPATPAAPPAGPAFLDPSQAAVDEPWPDGGGELFAPAVRAGAHEDFDRVVIDLTGSGDPGWLASYTEDPRLDGSGAAAGIAGDSVLELRLTGMAYPEPGSDTYSEGTFGLDTHTLASVVEVQRTAPFEGMLQVFVGMSGDPRPYRVFLLEEPRRLVVDVLTGP